MPWSISVLFLLMTIELLVFFNLIVVETGSQKLQNQLRKSPLEAFWVSKSVSVRVFQTNRPIEYIVHKETFKQLTHVIVEPGKSEICMVGQKSGHTGKSCCLESEIHRTCGRLKLRQDFYITNLRQNFFFSG